MTATFLPGRAQGVVAAPPSKSHAHRLLICASLAGKGSSVLGIADSRDMRATTECLSALGADIRLSGDLLTVQGGMRFQDGQALLPCGESASTLRFFLPLALVYAQNARFIGSDRLMERGIGVYEELFRKKGVSIARTEDGFSLCGHLTPGRYEMPGNVSSQFATGLLLALPLLDGDSELAVIPPVESRPYIDLTLGVLDQFGVFIEEVQPNRFFVRGGQVFRPQHAQVESDWSNAAPFLALNDLGGSVRVTGLNENSLQGDRVFPSLLARLRGTEDCLNLADCPDLAPILFAAAAALGRGARFTGTRRLQIKESDRAHAMAEELFHFGVRMEVGENDVRICPGQIHAPRQVLNGHGDHRVVMALSILSSVTGGKIEGAEAVEKSNPEFFHALKTLGLCVSLSASGLAGAGNAECVR